METSKKYKFFFLICVLSWIFLLPVSIDLDFSYLSHISITLMFSGVFTVLVNIYHQKKWHG